MLLWLWPTTTWVEWFVLEGCSLRLRLMSIFLLFFLLKKRISWGFCCKRSTISCWLISCFFWFSCFHAKKEKEKIQWNEHDSCIYLSLKDRNIISFFYISMEFNIFDGRLFREVYVFKCRLEIRVNSSKD